jgi:hypothetical protein
MVLNALDRCGQHGPGHTVSGGSTPRGTLDQWLCAAFRRLLPCGVVTLCLCVIGVFRSREFICFVQIGVGADRPGLQRSKQVRRYMSSTVILIVKHCMVSTSFHPDSQHVTPAFHPDFFVLLAILRRTSNRRCQSAVFNIDTTEVPVLGRVVSVP